MISPQVFTGLAMPFILAVAAVTNFTDPSKTKALWTTLALIGGSLFMVGGILYSDPFIICVEILFLSMNGYGLFSELRARRELARELPKEGFDALA